MARFVSLVALVAIAAVLVLTAVAQDPATPATPDAPKVADTPAPEGLASDAQRVSYAIGLDIGNNLKQQGVEVDATALNQGLADALTGAQPKLTKEQMQAAMMALQQKLMQAQMAKAQQAGAKNSEEGKAYLAENAKKEGVKTTASGLQYEVIKEGEGAKPAATDIVTVHYTGTLIDGTVFDSSVQRGEPTTFPLNQVIAGWTEGVQLMTKGAKYRFVIPSDLAYSERGAGQRIGPNATLIFEVELIDFKKAE